MTEKQTWRTTDFDPANGDRGFVHFTEVGEKLTDKFATEAIHSIQKSLLDEGCARWTIGFTIRPPWIGYRNDWMIGGEGRVTNLDHLGEYCCDKSDHH